MNTLSEAMNLNRIRKYILDNPFRWAIDRENPGASNPEAENPWEEKIKTSLK